MPVIPSTLSLICQGVLLGYKLIKHPTYLQVATANIFVNSTWQVHMEFIYINSLQVPGLVEVLSVAECTNLEPAYKFFFKLACVQCSRKSKLLVDITWGWIAWSDMRPSCESLIIFTEKLHAWASMYSLSLLHGTLPCIAALYNSAHWIECCNYKIRNITVTYRIYNASSGYASFWFLDSEYVPQHPDQAQMGICSYHGNDDITSWELLITFSWAGI